MEKGVDKADKVVLSLADLEAEIVRLRAEVTRLTGELAQVDALLGGGDRERAIRGLQTGQVAGGAHFEFKVGS